MAASPFANYGDYFNIERSVNATWNTILSNLFGPLTHAAGSWIVVPESYPLPDATTGKRTDLAVRQLLLAPGTVTPMAISRPRIAYEGKGANSDSLGEVEDQLEAWMADENLLSDRRCWCIGTRGNLVRFWKYQGIMEEQRWDAGTLRVVAGAGTYDVKVAAQWTTVMAILVYMRNNAA